MLALLRKHWLWFTAIAVTAIALRLFLVTQSYIIDGDSLVYGEIAKALGWHHMYGMERATGWEPTMIRMPGYPLLLAATFRLTAPDRFFLIMAMQAFVDVMTAVFIGDLARRAFASLNRPGLSDRAARSAFLLAATCPFLICYTYTPLTECFETFCTAAAFDLAFMALDRRQLRWWAWCGAAIAAAILLRPDGGLVLGCIGLPVLYLIWREAARRRELILSMLLLGVVSLAPLVPWTIRNYRVFHQFQPLVDAHAVDPGEFIPAGFESWWKTWGFDYAHTMDIGFPVPGEAIHMEDVPAYAFDSPAQRAQVAALFAEYNSNGYDIGPELDRKFGEVANQISQRHPLRCRLVMPLARTLDMWLRPRTEMFPLDVHFWQVKFDPRDSRLSISLGLLNLFYMASAVAGVWLLRRQRFTLALLLTFPIVRSLFLATTGNSEDRYTIECFPIVLALAGGWLASHILSQRKERSGAPVS